MKETYSRAEDAPVADVRVSSVVDPAIEVVRVSNTVDVLPEEQC
jgi:hypothetical protein